MKRMPMLLCTVLLASMLAACGTRTSNAFRTHSAGSSPLAGTYTSKLTQTDLDPASGYTGSTGSPGTWKLVLGTDGSFTVSKNGVPEPNNKGTYTVKNTQFTITDPGCGQNFPGTYIWMFAQMTLALTAIEDQCINRKVVLTTHPWVKQGVRLVVQSIRVSMNPADLGGITCTYKKNFIYTVNVYVNNDNSGGDVQLQFYANFPGTPTNTPGTQLPPLHFASGVTQNAAEFSLTFNVSAVPPVTVSSTSPNTVTSSASPTGGCSPT